MTSAFVLVVEDEPDLRDSLAEHFEERGYRVKSADTAESAWEELVSDPPDLVICDIRLPGENGLALMSWARENAETETVPFVFLTAFNTRDDRLIGKRLGAEDYLGKPVDLEELETTVQSRIGQIARIDRRHRDELARAEQRAALLSQAHEDLARAAETRLRPLATAALGYADALAAGVVAPVSNAAQQRYLNALNESLHALVNRLPEVAILAQTGTTRTDDPETNTPTGVRATLQACLDKSPNVFQAATTRLDWPETDIAVKVDPARLRRILDHLMSALALMATDKMGVDIRLGPDDTAGARLDVHATQVDAAQVREAADLLGDGQNTSETLLHARPASVGLFAAATLAGLEGGRFDVTPADDDHGITLTVAFPETC